MIREQWFTAVYREEKEDTLVEWLIEVNTDDLEVNAYTVDESSEDRTLAHSAKADDIGSLQGAYEAMLAEIEQGADELFGMSSQSTQPMDIAALHAQYTRRAERARLDPVAPRESRWPDIESRIHALIHEADLGDLEEFAEEQDLELTAEDLIDTFHYVIEIDRNASRDSARFSKIGGKPDVSAGVTLPAKPYTFLCQFDFAELAPFDLDAQLPEQGAVYFFVKDGQVHTRAVYTSEVPSTRDASGKTLTFSPNFYFEQGSDTSTPSEIFKMLPADLTSAISTLIGRDEPRASIYLNSEKFFGGEMDWQMMGEELLEMPLMLMLDHADGTLHLGMHPDDLLRADFEALETGYSGT